MIDGPIIQETISLNESLIGRSTSNKTHYHVKNKLYWRPTTYSDLFKHISAENKYSNIRFLGR